MSRLFIAALLLSVTVHAQDAPKAPPAGEGSDPWFGTLAERLMDALDAGQSKGGDTKQALEQLGHAIRRQPKQWKAQADYPLFANLRASVEFEKLIARW